MSGWDAYITSMKERSPAIKRAAILGVDGAIWAKTPDFRATDAELKKFANQFTNTSTVPQTGADLEEIHYIVPRVEEKLIFGKKEKTGFFAVKINTAVLVAIYEGDNAESAAVRAAVEAIADFLEKSGY